MMGLSSTSTSSISNAMIVLPSVAGIALPLFTTVPVRSTFVVHDGIVCDHVPGLAHLTGLDLLAHVSFS